MKTFHNIALALTALLLVTSCAIDEMWSDVEPADEQKVLTFKPKFEDFETVTKAIGDGSKVDKLLVQVYEENGETPVFSDEYDRDDWNKVQIAFYYGKTYKVYFWAYKSDGNAYEIAEGGLKNGVTVIYPDNKQNLAYNALEHLDAFYAVETINLSDTNPDNTTPSLTRPFAQVNLLANKEELENAKASTVIFELSAASDFVPGGDAIGEPVSRTFTFTSNDYFQSTETLDGNVYLGTTYIFVSSSPIYGTVTLKDEDGKTLKGPSDIQIPLAINSRTNLVFSGIQPAKLPWDDNKFVVPRDDDNDGWIHITCPEELAALLIKPSGDNINVHICDDIDMGDVDDKILNQITGKSFLGLILDGGIYPDNNMEDTPTGNNTIKNLSAAAFIGNATNLTVRNLTVDNLHITNDDGHVGTIVNTLKGTSSFSNVKVFNSSATTTTENGAAGGIVGYIERISPKARSEEMNVAFYNCSVNGSQDKPVANGNDAEGKFVGKFSGYDYREKLTFDNYCTATENTEVTDYPSRYTEKNEGEWLETNDYTKYNGFLGDETYNRGTIMYGSNQFVPMWDGNKQVPLMDAIQEYDGWSSGKVIYSAFDLASLQGLNITSDNYYLCADVDLGGDGQDGQVGKLDKDRNMQECGADDALFNPINYIANLNGVKKDKIGTEQASLTESDNYSIYNCKVVLDKHDGIGAGFIKQVTGTTTNHNNINLVRAYVYNHHDETIPEQKYYQNDNGSGNAYAGTFVSTVGGTYNISNIHVSYGHVMAVCKIGGIIGRVSGVLNMSNCSVHNHTVENWEANIINWYPMAMPLSDWMVYINQSWYTQGECGGLIGFIKSKSASITKCSVTDTDINCYGQPDKQVTAGVYLSGWTSIEAAGPNPGGVKGYTIIAGRHVNQFIGDVVSERSESGANSDDYTVTIRDYYVSGNKYHGVPVQDQNTLTLDEVKSHPSPRTILYNASPTSHAYGFTYKERSTGWLIKTYYYTHTVTSFCNCIGSAYYVGVDVNVMGVEKHVRHCAGKLVFNEKGKPAVTVTEAIKDGNNIAWTGGDFWM